MEGFKIPRIMIVATGSGSGKTTVTCGLLQAFLNRGQKLASFKCGPDYIDPMFHAEVLGIKSRNLDLFFTEENITKYLLSKNAREAELTIIEGVMGYYDGLAGKSTECSSYDLARTTKTPAILVVDCKGMSISVLAVIKGFFQMYEDNYLAGVILNRISPMLYPETKKLIEEELGICVFGYLPQMKNCSIKSRHLGLIIPAEITNIKEIILEIANQIEETIDLDLIQKTAEGAPALTFERNGGLEKLENMTASRKERKVRMAIARDKAFCFYYQDNLDLLEALGTELVPFSPLEDSELPVDIQGLIIGGGYPELYLEQLSANKTMLYSIKTAIDKSLPCIAECGGFMYLQESIKNKDGMIYKMVGAIDGESFPTDKLTRFGYLSLIAQEDNLICKKEQILQGHEFHYWDSTNCGKGFIGKKPLGNRSWECVVADAHLWAGYPHIHFYSNIEGAIRFLQKCEDHFFKMG